MKGTLKVIVLEDNFASVREAVTGDMLMEAARAGGHVIEAHAKINASRGRPGLEVKTSALVGSINVTEAKSTETYAEVDVGPSVLYAAIHEFGGIIVPVTKRFLSWVQDGIRIFANEVHIPARPFMRPAVDENEDRIVNAVAHEIRRGIENATS